MVLFLPHRLLLRYLGVDGLTPQVQGLVRKYYTLSALAHASVILSSTFYVLFVIDTVGVAKLGLLVAIGFGLQAIIDFPTGVIADWIGYKWVLFSSYLFHTMAFILLGLIGLFLLEAIALALESGAMQAWFDNNYKLMIEDQDQDLQIYRGVFGKTLLLIRAIGSGTIYLGGFLTNTIDREGVFLTQGVFMLLLALVFLITIEDFQTRGKTVTSLKDFLADLFLGFKLLFQSRSSLFFQLSYIISIITNLLWTSLIIYPLYFGYTGSDPKAA
ncbi:MAG: hypothetical protein ACXAB7_22385, partial [Candidatus Kariarchaeaceae archaeon]